MPEVQPYALKKTAVCRQPEVYAATAPRGDPAIEFRAVAADTGGAIKGKIIDELMTVRVMPAPRGPRS